jgi:hypothetical protein
MIIKKIKVLGINKSNWKNYYIFPKKKEVFEIIRNLLRELSFEEWEWNRFGRPIDKKYGEPILNKEENIKKYVDEIMGFDNKEYSIEVVFGRDKVFLIIHTKTDKQQKISKILDKFIQE